VNIKDYDTKKSVWASKPETMICKVAEAQGLRMAFPALFAGTYNEAEDWTDSTTPTTPTPQHTPEEVEEWKKRIQETKTKEELKKVRLEYYREHIKTPFNSIQNLRITEVKNAKKEALAPETSADIPQEDVNIFDDFNFRIKMCQSEAEILAVGNLLETS